ncbi:N-acetylmuramoyl-L-alanine amidase [Flavobacterium sp.]|jgi:N-acetylmuramoyl-L-alanine amidase|uniref:N-acetylmuramoyl-L-alanine amidase n=1 Tax=Flavobacterium sp. TaxID=239 RepID=UPI0037C0C730
MARDVEHIVVHCSATPADMDIGATEIKRWHRERGFRDIGYHYVIRRDGAVQRGRHLNRDARLDNSEAGAHVAGINSISVGVCLVGGVRREGAKLVAEANFTPLQFAALRTLLAELRVQFPKADVQGHRDHAKGKDCPSFDVKAWVKAGEPDSLPAAKKDK